MSKIEIAGIIIGAMLVLIALRVPLGAAMFVAGAGGYWWLVGEGALLNYLKGLLWARFSVYDLSVIPLFLLMGQFASAAGFSRNLFHAANTLVGHRNGGVAQAAIIACACFGAICGSSVATAATMSQVALPEMRRLNYSDRLATGTLAAGGTLGILVPPSIILIIYALLAQQSIAKLFAAAVIPGIIAAVGYMIALAIYVRLVPGHAQIQPRATSEERLRAIGEAWPIAAIFLIMFVGIYGGFFTPTEGAAVATAATLGLAVARRQLNWSQIVKCFLPAAQASAMIYTMLLGAAMMNTALAVTQVPADVATWAAGLDAHPLLIVSGFLAIFVVLTCVLDELAMMLLLLPVLLPTILGLDLFGMTIEEKAIWFGILMLVVVSVGLIAPPIGLDVYVVHNIAKTVPIGEIYRGIMPFLASDVVRILLLLFVPSLTLWAVRLMN
jgi:tripartite ATP-independent transporter DctM subunit